MSDISKGTREPNTPKLMWSSKPVQKSPILLGFLTVLAFWLASCATEGDLKPLLPTSTPLPSFVVEPQLVTFAELQSDPLVYQDSVIRVTGDYRRLPLPDCIPNSGPGARWSLIADNLRLDVVGFERLLHLIKEPATFTLDGIFRLYDAPLGCGKQPPVQSAWYLDALNVVAPNPLHFTRSIGEIIELIDETPGDFTRTPLPVMTATPDLISTPIPTPTDNQIGTPQSTLTITVTGTSDVTLTQTPGSGTGTTTSIPTATSQLTPVTVTPTPTNMTVTPNGTVTPTSTPDPGNTVVPLPTATTGEGGGGYPPPPDPYP
jgi:hypothetical protein